MSWIRSGVTDQVKISHQSYWGTNSMDIRIEWPGRLFFNFTYTYFTLMLTHLFKGSLGIRNPSNREPSKEFPRTHLFFQLFQSPRVSGYKHRKCGKNNPLWRTSESSSSKRILTCEISKIKTQCHGCRLDRYGTVFSVSPSNYIESFFSFSR